jgi:hypothetical protein
VAAVENLPVADGGLGRHLQDLRRGERANHDFQAAEVVSPRAVGEDLHVVAAHRRPPTAIVDHDLETKAGQLIGHLPQALLDPLGKLQAILGIQPANLVFAHRPAGLLLGPRAAFTRATLDRLFESLLEVHDNPRGPQWGWGS